MTRLGTVLLLLCLCIPISAKVSNFTVKDLHGNEHNLYEYLNDGKHVLIEFMMFD